MNPETFSYLLPATARDRDRESRERGRRNFALSGSEKVESKLNLFFPGMSHNEAPPTFMLHSSVCYFESPANHV